MSDHNPPSEPFRNVPHGAEPYGTVPHDAESYRTLPKAAERKENHTLSVREVARMFEVAGVARIERSIVNWCHPNRFGIARLDCYFDPNERKYFITPQSVELAIKEEQAKTTRSVEAIEPVAAERNDSESERDLSQSAREDRDMDAKALLRQITDLKITNRVKEQVIERFEKERDTLIDKLMTSSHRIGELETKLLQLEAPRKYSELKTEPPIDEIGNADRAV